MPDVTVSEVVDEFLRSADADAARNNLGASSGVWPAALGGTGFAGEPFTDKFVRRSHYKLALMRGRAPNQCLTVLNMGDSMADLLSQQYIPALHATYGNAGYGLGATQWEAADGATSLAGEFDLWLDGILHSLPPGGSVTFGRKFNRAKGVQATRLVVYYLTDPAAATTNTFKVQSSYYGGAWTDQATIDVHNAGGVIGAVSTTTVTRGLYRIRVLGVSGTCRVIGVAMLDPSTNGVAQFQIAAAGNPINNFVRCPAEISEPILQSINPDLVTVEKKDSLAGVTEHLATLDDIISTGCANADIVYIGSGPRGDTGSADQVQRDVNAFIRAFTQTNSRGYFDAYYPLVSFADMESIGWEGDTVHGTTYSHAYLASIFLRASGLIPVNGMLGGLVYTSARKTSEQIFVNNAAAAKVAIDNTDDPTGWDFGGMFDATQSRFVVPTTGYYEISADINGDHSFRSNWIYINGVPAVRLPMQDYLQQGGKVELKLSEGDYAEHFSSVESDGDKKLYTANYRIRLVRTGT